MKNIEIADIFYNIATLLEMDEVSFRSRAYEKAARNLESLDEDVEEIYARGGTKELEKIPGIGQGLARAIEDYLKKGRIKDYQDLKKKCPVKIEELSAIEGLGPKMIKTLYQKLGIKNLKDLAKAAQAQKIRNLEGFGAKTEANILQGIDFVKKDQGRFLLGEILPLVRVIVEELGSLKEVAKISVAGSVRRMKETIGDADILVISSQPTKVMDYFVKMKEVQKVWSKGETRSSVRLSRGFDCDLRVIKKNSYGSALQYFTGNKYHNILARRLAIKKGLKLNEYGIFKGQQRIAGQTEASIYQAIDLPYIEPELRENRGEIEAAQQGQLPKVIGYQSIKGDCHMHSTWSDGQDSILAMAQQAKRMGYQYIVITDHTKSLNVAHGLDEKKLAQQIKEIKKINQQFSGFQILTGCEANILEDGSIDIDDEMLSQLDVVVAGIHSKFKMKSKEMTQRLIKAIENPYVKIIAHPTGRMLLQRPSYQFDFEEILAAAKKNKVALEINSHPSRLDLKDVDIKRAVEAGVKLVISTDAHHQTGLQHIELGIAQARRGWATAKDILNTCQIDEFMLYWK